MSKRVNLAVPANGGLYKIVGINTSQDISAWQSVAYVYDPENPSVALAAITLEIDTDDKTIALKMTPTEATSLLGSETTKRLNYVLLVKPGGFAYGLRFFYGAFSLLKGGPSWS